MNVLVDRDFARFGAKSYAINKINSVEVRERQPNGIGPFLVCLLLALLCLSGFVNSFSTPEGVSTGYAVLTVALGIGAYFLLLQTKVREYQLFLMTSSSETQAFVTHDRNEVERLRHEIESSMLRHSRIGSDR